MSSSSAAFARALSPSLDGLTQAIINNTRETDWADKSDDLILIIHAKLAECRTVEQVIDTVYSDYRPAFREFLQIYASWYDKLESVKASKVRLAASLEAQSVPPRLRVKAPEFQFTKEFVECTSDVAIATRNAFTVATATFQEAINAASLAGKEAECSFWGDKCDPAFLLEKLSDVVASVWNERRSSFKIPSITYDDNGKPKLGGWDYSSQKIVERDTLIRAIPLLATQIGQIVGRRHHAMSVKINKKKDLSAKADVEMADATRPGPSIQSLIDKGMNARFKKLNLVPGKKASSSGQDKKKQAPKSDATSSKAPQQGKKSSKAAPKKKQEIKTAQKKADNGKRPDRKGKGRA